MRKVQPGEVREYAGYLTERVKDEAGYAAPASRLARHGDYYLGTPGEPNAEPLGVWTGRGAERLGLLGEVDGEHLLRVWQGQDPATGAPVIRPGANGEHVPAIDMVVSVPKSVSLAWALEGDPARRAEIEAALTRATEATIAVLERDCPLVARRVDGRMVREPAAGLVISRFRHHTARTTDAQAERGDGADPDLHDHVVIANYAVRQDGSVGAIDSLAAMRWQRVYTQLHYAQLARELRRLGYQTVRVRDHFELAGVSQEAITEFSRRSEAIDERVAEFRARYGRPPTPEEHQQLVRETRRGKDTHPLGDRERWAAREAALDHRTPPAGQTADPSPPLLPMAAINDQARARAKTVGEAGQSLRSTEEIVADVLAEITTGEHRLVRESAVVDTLELQLAVARALAGGDGTDIVEQHRLVLEAVTASPELVRLDREHWTTRRHLELEQAVLDVARVKATPAAPTASLTPSPERVGWHIAHARVPLDAEQRAAVRALCDRQGLALVLAEAGTGKGEVARVVAAIHRELGYRVVAVSTAAQRAEEFGRDVGADECRSMDSLVHSCSQGFGLGPRTLVLADEVGQTDTYRWADLLRAVGDAPLRGFGDTEQLDAVEAGGMLRVLERELGAAPLRAVYRTRDQELVDLWRRVRAGERGAVEDLDRRGALVFVDSLPEAREGLVGRWDAARLAGEEREGRPIRDFLVATNISNRQVDHLNALAQQRRLERGELGGPSIEVLFEDASRGYRRTERLHAGDHVRLVASGMIGANSVRNGQAGRVVAIGDDGSAVVEIEGRREQARARFAAREDAARARFERAAASRREAFDQEQRAAAARHAARGIDPARIGGWRCTARERFDAREARLREDSERRWAVRRAEFLATGEGATVRFGPEQLPMLRLGYAGHDQTTQGRTAQTLDGLLGREATDRQHAYVELSRAREDARFHVSLDQWLIPRERVILEAEAEPRVEAIAWDERVAMAKVKIAEAFQRDRPKLSALEFRAQALADFAEAETRRLVREQAAVTRAAEQPATPRQLACARAAGADVPEGATWVQASVAIEAARGEEPGTFARQALSTRHAPEHVDEVVGAAVDRQLARAFEPAMDRDAALPEEPTAAMRLAEEASGSERERSAAQRDDPERAEEPGLTGRAAPLPGLTGDRDGSVNALDVPDTPSDAITKVQAAPEPAPLQLAEAELEAAEEAHLAAVEPARVDRQEEPEAEPEAEPDVELAATPSPHPAPDVLDDQPEAQSAAVEVDQAAAPELDARRTQDDQPSFEGQRAAEAAQEAREAEQSARRQAEADAARQADEERAQAEREAERAAELKAEAELEAASQREVESDRQADEAQPEPEPEPTPEPLGPEWSYDLWAEPTDDPDHDRRARRGMGMEM